MRKPKHGGKRPGSGRPRAGKVTLYVRISPEMRTWLELVADRSGETLSTVTEATLVLGSINAFAETKEKPKK